ncbi:MAG: hypothetical protein WBC40_01455 [Halobacteriota archaeon]
MVKQSRARLKLEQARFFTVRASEVIPAQREAFVNFIEAAIVFARSVTFCLQSEYRHKPDFDRWYLGKQEAMKKDPIFAFFRDKRNYILKEGSASVHKAVSVAIEEHVGVSDFVEIKVIRGQPWYRRSPKILWEDFRVAIMKPIRRWLWQRETKRRHLQLQKQSKVEVTESFFFDEPKWRDCPACDLLQEYLNNLEQIIAEAEIRFNR